MMSEQRDGSELEKLISSVVPGDEYEIRSPQTDDLSPLIRALQEMHGAEILTPTFEGSLQPLLDMLEEDKEAEGG